MRTCRYHRVDVFTDLPFCGNPLAVFPESRGLDTDLMHLIAREMNLSETVFVLPPTQPGASKKLRIFTIDRELPLAGHPVVGAAHVLASTGAFSLKDGRNQVALELGAGVLPVEVDMHDGAVQSVFMTQRTPRFAEPFDDLALVARALGLHRSQFELGDLKPRVVDTGIPWFLIPVIDKKALESVRPSPRECELLATKVGTDLFHAFTQDTGGPESAARTRHVWFGSATPGEDPVTGSAIGCIASYLVREGVLLAAPIAQFTIEQGEDVGRPGKVDARVEVRGGEIVRVQVGGTAVHLGDGEIWLPE